MAKKPAPGPVNAPQGNDLHLSLDLDQYDSEDDQEGDFDLSDFSDSDGDLDSDVTLEDFTGNDLKLSGNHGSEKPSKVKGASAANANSLALVPTDGGPLDPYQVDSDEEKDLLKGIKDEIKEMVRGEMKSELEVYEHKMKAIEDGRLPSATGEGAKEEDKYPDLANLDPQLREAYIKMRKLDRILEKKVKKEREVKRDRILLERRIRDEIGSLKANGRVQRDIQANTDRYLALALPPSHNEGVVVDEPPVTPLFQTQVDEKDLQGRPKASGTSTAEGDRQSSATSSRTDDTASTMDGDLNSRQQGRQHGRRKKKKDFIKRNKELAANANDMIAMTDDEKKRLQELLSDVDALPEIPEEGLNISIEENPYQVAIHPGEGFLPSDNELRTLTAIDQRLQSIMPEEDFRSIASSSLSHATQHRLFTRVGVRSEVDFDSYGEKALMETKEERELTASLKTIEDQLVFFQNTEANQAETPALTEQQLDSLLDDCVRSLSRVSMPADTPESVDSARSLESARAQLMLHPPRLSDETLQKLLSEAHFPLSSHLLALQDDDSKSANGDEGGAIRAETWKAIAEATLSGDEDERSSMASTPQASNNNNAAITNHTLIRQSAVNPQPSMSDPSFQATQSRRAAFNLYGSQSSDSDGRESRVSLPEICASPLINMPQGNPTAVPNNQSERGGARGTRSLDNMVHNDLSWDHPLSGTPLMVEEVGGQDYSTPTPQPPPLSDRRSAPRLNRRSSSEVKDTDH